MGNTTQISWCDSSCNFLVGCSGCELYPSHCYANALVSRHAGKKGWPESFTKPQLFPERVDQALKWKDLTGTERKEKPWLNGMPRVVFVNDLGDTFSPAVSNEQADKVIDVFSAMANSPHVWLFLTKWPLWMREAVERYISRYGGCKEFPLNIWLGVSVTDQKTAAARMPILLDTPASVRFVSCEPMLERIDFSVWLGALDDVLLGDPWRSRLNWAIFGGESGRNHRPLDIVGMESAVNQCSTAGVQCFVKQDSGPRPGQQGRIPDYLWKVKEMPKWSST